MGQFGNFETSNVMRFAIVDIETTGGSPLNHRILEIGIVLIEDGQIISKYQSLINPGMHIPYNVILIHGITNEMVDAAPTFAEIASDIEEMTREAVFVAHSVAFDFGFIKAEFTRIGKSYDRKRLCTVRLSKRLLPGLKSHSLASLCQFYKIQNKRAHRALEDAEATAGIFLEVGQIAGYELVLKEFLNRKSKEMSLPPHIKKESFTRLPGTIGVYIFHDMKGKVIYVGKANHIKDRVGQHFSGNTHTKTKQAFLNNIYEVEYQETGHELMALLIENELIKKHYPRFNSTNKDFNLNFGIYQYPDQKGFIRLVIGETGKWSQPVSVFRTKAEATLSLLKTSMKNGLCLAFNQLLPEKNTGCKYETEDGQMCMVCSQKITPQTYNSAIEGVILNWQEGKSYILQMAGRQKEEMALVWVKSGKISGYGFMPTDQEVVEMNDLKPFLKSYYDTQDAQSILKPFLTKAIKKGSFDNGIAVLELAN